MITSSGAKLAPFGWGGGGKGTLPCRYVKCPAQKWVTKMPAIQDKLIYCGYLKELDISQLVFLAIMVS